jgi:hypothetical protein
VLKIEHQGIGTQWHGVKGFWWRVKKIKGNLRLTVYGIDNGMQGIPGSIYVERSHGLTPWYWR